MALCANLRDLDIFLYVSNREDFGHLVNPESFDITIAEPDMYQIFDNEKDWEDRWVICVDFNRFICNPLMSLWKVGYRK